MRGCSGRLRRALPCLHVRPPGEPSRASFDNSIIGCPADSLWPGAMQGWFANPGQTTAVCHRSPAEPTRSTAPAHGPGAGVGSNCSVRPSRAVGGRPATHRPPGAGYAPWIHRHSALRPMCLPKGVRTRPGVWAGDARIAVLGLVNDLFPQSAGQLGCLEHSTKGRPGKAIRLQALRAGYTHSAAPPPGPFRG